jgi:hypothetical protein
VSTQKECVAGFGQHTSVWLEFNWHKLVGCTVEESRRHEYVAVDDWLVDHFLVVPVRRKHGPKETKRCLYLTYSAGRKAADAIRDYSVVNLGLAFIAQYGWQIANGAKPLRERGELAKVYAGGLAVYLYLTRKEKQRAEARVQVSVEALRG